MKTITFPVKGLNVAGCAREIEKRLRKQDGISQVEASYVTQTVTITFDDTRLSEAALREQVQDCGFACGEPHGAWQRAPGAMQEGGHVHPAAAPGQAAPHAAHISEQENLPGPVSMHPSLHESGIPASGAGTRARHEHAEHAGMHHEMPSAHAGMHHDMMGHDIE